MTYHSGRGDKSSRAGVVAPASVHLQAGETAEVVAMGMGVAVEVIAVEEKTGVVKGMEIRVELCSHQSEFAVYDRSDLAATCKQSGSHRMGTETAHASCVP